ncbi:MAG: hypothetical protein EAZ92_05330 [Candidatus Kapaibacterium sp.]|nr:MAG: hypothetical protein EAZ92_05330 [Candidatus Kapabacteria bacterium]
MISIIIVALVGGTLVARSFLLFKRIGREEYKGQEKYLLTQAIGGILVAFILVLVISAVLKFTGMED